MYFNEFRQIREALGISAAVTTGLTRIREAVGQVPASQLRQIRQFIEPPTGALLRQNTLARLQGSFAQLPVSQLAQLRHGTLARLQNSLDDWQQQEALAARQVPATEPGLTEYKSYFISIDHKNAKWQVDVSCGGTQPGFKAELASGSEAMTRAKKLIDLLENIDIDFCDDSVRVTFAPGTGLTEARAFGEALHGFEIVPA